MDQAMPTQVALTVARRPSTAVDAGSPAPLDRRRYLGMVSGDDLEVGRPCDLSVVIVTHESAADIDACLASLRAVADEADFEVIVVDNASVDGTAARVADRFPEFRLVRKTRRDGFATNSNIGVTASAGRHIMLLNPDTVVRPGALRQLVGYLDANPDVGAVGPRLVYPDGRPQPSARRFPTATATLLRRTPARFLVRDSVAEQGHLMVDDHATERDADWLLGAAVALRATALRELGGLDEGYRLYCEDIDLCWRLHTAGWRVRFTPSVTVEHALAETTRKRFLTIKTVWHLRSMVRFVRLHGLTSPPRPDARIHPAAVREARHPGVLPPVAITAGN